jgi:AmmeMemoRadiSam system protein B
VNPARRLIAELRARAHPWIRTDNELHRKEGNAIEAQLPFLLAMRPDVTILPLLVGKLNRAQANTIAAELAGLIATSVEGAVGLVGCANLGHRGPRFGAGVLETQRCVCLPAILSTIMPC